jgi:hypothetical protein
MNFKKIKRSFKNIFLGYNSVEVLTRLATRNDESYPTHEVMEEVARLTHVSVKLHQIMEVIHKRIFDIYHLHHIRKAIILLDYLLTFGNEKVYELSYEWYGFLACLMHFCEHGICDSIQKLLTKLAKWRRNTSKKAMLKINVEDNAIQIQSSPANPANVKSMVSSDKIETWLAPSHHFRR